MQHEIQEYYEASFELFASKGWKYLLEDLKGLELILNNVRTVENPQQLHFRLGQLDILDLILKRKEACEKVYEELLDENLE